MRPIPITLRNRLASLKFYKKCCVCGSYGTQWHHNLKWQGRQENEEFCILPLCVPCHNKADNSEFREMLNWIMWNRASQNQIDYYSKATNYNYELKRLNDKFGGSWINSVKEK